MEVAVSRNDSQLSPPLQHQRSRYSTPDPPNTRSPSILEPSTTLPIVTSQELESSIRNSSQTQQLHPQLPHPVSIMEPEGQNHDRMDTDDASEGSELHPGNELPRHDGAPNNSTPIEAPASADAGAMDTTPDVPEAGHVGLPSGPQTEGGEPTNSQNANREGNVNHNLVRTNSRGSTVESENSTVTPPQNNANANTNFHSAIIDPATGQPTTDTHLVTQTAEDWPPLFPSQTQPNVAQPPSLPLDIQPPAEEGDQNQGQEEDSPSEDSADEEEQPYWANFSSDKSMPSEEEIKLIEQDTGERSAIDHEYWEGLAFEALDDPEYIPTDTGRIEWTLKGFHGTPEKPNKEVVMRSPSVAIGGYYWNIKLYPRGNENTDSMSVYVECSTKPSELETREAESSETNATIPVEELMQQQGRSDHGQSQVNERDRTSPSAAEQAQDDHPPASTEAAESSPNVSMEDLSENQGSWEVPAQVLCIAYNPDEPRVHAYQRITHRYHKDTADWGWTRFHGPWERLHKRERLQRRAMLQDDTMSFTAYIRTVKDDTGALWWHSPGNRPEWDSFERLGLNRLWVGSPESSAVLCAVSTWLHISPFCSSITNPVFDNYPRALQRKDRPLHEELEHIRGQLASALRESDENLTLINIAEMLDWHNAGNCEPDVVSDLDILRRTLSCEALKVKQSTETKDIFGDIVLLKQPNPATTGGSSQGADSIEPNTVQEVVNAASSCLQDSTISKQPAVLQVELHRQNYDLEARKWKKLTHRISIDETITFQRPNSTATSYTLFGAVVHSGDLESKDYSNIIRPQGPGSRWIKYSGDKASRGVECLTTKEALRAHEGGDSAARTSAVAYLITYVRSDLLPNSPESTPVKSIKRRKTNSTSDEFLAMSDTDVQIPVYIYQSSIFGDHQGLGVANWIYREIDDIRVLKIEASGSTYLGELSSLIDDAYKAAKPDATGKYTMWFLDTVKGNAAMENVVRAPEMLPFNGRGPDTRLRDYQVYYGVCRVWLDDDLPPQPEIPVPEPTNTTLETSASQASPQSPQTPPPLDDNMQVDDDQPGNADPTTDTPMDASIVLAPPEDQAPRTDDPDTVMEGNADPDAAGKNAPTAIQHAWTANFDTKVLGNFENVFVLLKCFDAENQTLRGVKTLWVKQNDRISYAVRQAMSWDDEVAVEIYHEQILSTLVSVRSGSTFQDISGASNYMLVVQKRPNAKDVASLTAAGKPHTIPGFFRYQFSAHDPAYLQPYLTRSYFASPYFSGSIAYGLPHGDGTLITTSGDAYTGNFVSGSKSGQGCMRFANGDTYTGSWANDDPDGQGEMVYAKTGNVYTGGFRKRKRHGKGVMKFEVADEEERLCGICFEEEMDCCFYDCGHVAACEGCARQVDVCPVCRRGVKAVVRIWRS